MKVAELRAVITLDKVCIYDVSHEVEDLYVGEVNDIPVELMDREVLVVGARRKFWLDIGIGG